MTERLRHFLFLAGEDIVDDGRWRESATTCRILEG